MRRTSFLVATTSVVVAIAASIAFAQTRAFPPAGPGIHGLELTAGPTTSEPVERHVLIDTPHVQIVVITMRQGGSIAAHTVDMQATVQALRGSGVVRVGSTEEHIGPGRMVVIAPGVERSITPDGNGDLVILVHHIKSGGPGQGIGRGRGMGAATAQ